MSLFQKKGEEFNCSVVVVAAGSSERFGSDKLFALLDGEPVLARTISVFETCESVSEIVVVAPRDGLLKIAELCDRCGFGKVAKVVVGGDTRVESALSGVSETNRRAIAKPIPLEPPVIKTRFPSKTAPADTWVTRT